MLSTIDLNYPVRGAAPARPAARRPQARLTTALAGPAFLLAALLAALPGPALGQTQQPAPQGEVQTFQAPSQAPAEPVQAAPSTVTPPQRFGDWTRRCTANPPKEASPPKQGEQEVCFITQQLVDQNNQRPVLKITIGFFRPNRQPLAVIAMPLGVPLAGGVQVGVDGQRVAGVPFQVCREDGCQAYLPLSEEVLSAFKAGNQGVMQLHANQDQPLNMGFSLSGFTAGYGSIE